MKKESWLIALSLLLIVTLPAYTQGSRIKYLSPDSIYFYSMGSLVIINPLGDYSYGEDTRWGFMVGAGYTLINIDRMLLLNFEFDYSKVTYDLLSTRRDVNFFNFRLTGEFRFYPQLPVALYLGLGASNIVYSRTDILEEFNDTTAVVDTGIKIRLTKNVLIRGEVRFYTSPGNSEYYYLDDIYIFDEFDEGELVSSAISLGLEFRLK